MSAGTLEAAWSQGDGPGLEHLRVGEGGTCFRARYVDRGIFRGFTADLPVDENGLVLDYPGIFRRMS